MVHSMSKTPRLLRRSDQCPRGGAPTALLTLALIATGCDPALAPVAPEGVGTAGPLPVAFHRGMNLQPIGDYGGLLNEREIDASLDELVALGVDHVAVIPSFFQRRLGESDFYWEPSREAVDTQTRAVVAAAHERGLAVLLKPHLWLAERDDGAWRGDIAPSDADWPVWADNYTAALLDYARLAAELDIAGMSIGSELTRLALERPEFWSSLAATLRSEYSGFLTYAANWDAEFDQIQWWGAVDYAGVDAFWPLVDDASVRLTESSCSERMQGIRARLEAVSRSSGRPVLLTEIGYKSAVGAAHRPWEWHARQEADPEAQALIYRCIRDVFGTQPEPHIAGVYFWIWYTAASWGGPANSDFTPRGKPAEGVLAGWYSSR